MSDLTELIKQQWEIAPNAAKSLTENFAAGRKAQAEKMQMQEHQDLKALFASQAKPSVSSIGAIDPEFAQKTMKMQYDMYKDQADIEHKQAQTADLQQKEDLLKRQEMANGLKPHIERYEQQKASGVPEAQAGAEYQAATGALVANQAQAGRLPSNFKIDTSHTPQSAVSGMNAIGVKTLSQERLEERNKSQSRQQGLVAGGVPMNAEQAHGGIYTDPLTGLSTGTPSIAQAANGNVPMAAPDIQAEIAKNMEVANNPNASEYDRGLANSNVAYLTKHAAPTSVSPAEMQAARTTQAGDIEAAKETAIKTAQDKAATKLAVENYFQGRPPEEVKNLIRESLSGDLDSGVAKLGQVFGISTPGASASQVLSVVTQQLAKSSPFPPGSQSDKEYAARLALVGDPESKIPIESRLRAIEEFYRNTESYVAQKADLTSEQLIDAVHNGYLSVDNAKSIRSRMGKAK